MTVTPWRALRERGERVRVCDNCSTEPRGKLVKILLDIGLRDHRSIDARRRVMTDVRSKFHYAALPSVPRPIEILHRSRGECNQKALPKPYLLVAVRDAGFHRVKHASCSSHFTMYVTESADSTITWTAAGDN